MYPYDYFACLHQSHQIICFIFFQSSFVFFKRSKICINVLVNIFSNFLCLTSCWKIWLFLYNRKCEKELRKTQQKKNGLMNQITTLDQYIEKEKVMQLHFSFLRVQRRVINALEKSNTNTLISWFFSQCEIIIKKTTIYILKKMLCLVYY